MNAPPSIPAADSCAAPATLTAVSGPPLRWFWAAIGVLGVSVLALGATLVVQPQRAPAAAQTALASALAPRTPEHEIIDEKAPPVQAQPASAAPEPIAKPAPAGAAARPQPAARWDRAPVQQAAARAPVCAVCGQVESVQAVQQAAPASGVGAVAGGVLGAVVGNQIGKGSGRAAATVLGAVGGGYLGHTVEQRTRTQTVYDVRVRMEDGSVRQFQRAQPVPVGAAVTLRGKGFELGRAGAPAPQVQPAGYPGA